MHTPTAAYLHCSLCGFEFEKRQTTCASGCPLGRFCKLVRCPNCGYEFPETAEPLTWVQRLFHRPRQPRQSDSIPLVELDEGERTELVCLDSTNVARRNSLAVYGLVPGCELTLEQKWPTYVIRVGETELALETEVARGIRVRPRPV